MKFSERIGMSQKAQIIQTNSMDDALKNRLFNTVKEILDGYFTVTHGFVNIDPVFLARYCDSFGEKITDHNKLFKFFIQHLDYKIYLNDDVWFFYDFIEWLLDQQFHDYQLFAKKFNRILKEERSAYVLDVDNKLIKITDEIELEVINEATEITKYMEGVSEHLAKAKESFSNRENPNYKNCVRESIFAIESLSKIIVGDKDATLEKALKKIPHINENLRSSLIKLYHFRGDEGGIGHGNKEVKSTEITELEAKLILVTAHSIISYLTAIFLSKKD